MKVFVATSFSTQVDEQGRVLPAYRAEVESVLASLRAFGHHVEAAIETHGWLMGEQNSGDGIVEDTANLDSADCMVAMLTENPSAGVQFEIGYAVKAGKRVVLVPKPGTKLRWFNQGLVDAGLAELATPENVAEIITKS